MIEQSLVSHERRFDSAVWQYVRAIGLGPAVTATREGARLALQPLFDDLIVRVCA